MLFQWPGYTALFVLWVCCSAESVGNGCGPPPRQEREEPANLSDKESYNHGDEVTYNCRPGYIKLGRIKFQCRNGDWVQLPPIVQCRKKPCGLPGDAEFGSFELVRGEDFSFGARVVYKCREGYQMLSQFDYRDCRVDGWSNDVPHCEVKKCFPVTPPVNGKIVLGERYDVTQDFMYGDIVRFQCEGKFKIKGSAQISCTANSNWSAPIPECVEITCEAVHIEHGNILSQKHIYREGDRIQFSCARGFTHVDRQEAICTENGWSSRVECKEIQCSPPEVMHGHFQPKQVQYTYNEDIRLVCDQGFIFQGNGGISKCTQNGWDPPAVCQPRGCDYIVIKNGKLSGYYEYWRPFPRAEGQTIDYGCNSGYLAANRDRWHRATCTKFGYVPEPKCFKTCDTFRFHHGQFISNGHSNFIEGDNISFYCYEGYYPAEKQLTARCTEDGWSPSPRCVQIVQHTCENIPPKHGFFVDRKQHFKIYEEITFRCHDGYTTPEGGDEGRTVCLAEGWNPIPMCIQTCLRPQTPNIIYNKTKSVFLNEDELYYECKEGFQTIKNTIGDTIVCQEGRWEPVPGCLPIDCELTFLDNGDIKPRKNKFHHGMVINFFCRKGFTRVGAESAQCYHFGWSPPPPACKENIKSCQALSNISHGLITGELKEEYQHGDKLDVQCELSFALLGPKYIECIDGEWSYLPLCIEELKTCELPPAIQNGQPVNVESRVYKHGETVSYECKSKAVTLGTNQATCVHGQWELPTCKVRAAKCTRPGNAEFVPVVPPTKFFHTNFIATYRCDSKLHKTKCVDGVWVPNPECKGFCPPPPQLPNSINIAEMRIHNSGEEISFKCKEFFFLHGPQKIVCENGKWQTPPRCLDLRCGNPPTVPNGEIKNSNQTVFLPGESVEYICHKGFETKQLNSVICENKKWSKPPVCKEKSCGSPPKIPNASLDEEDKEQYDSGKTINYTCNQGFDSKKQPKITCKQGEWVISFTCQDSTCPEPPRVENAEIIENTKEKYLPGQQINYRCNDGFEISGSPTLTCMKKNWSPLPRCEDATCSSPPIIDNGEINGQIKERYLPLEKVSYRCRPRYSLFGSPVATCSKKRWTEAPKCIDAGGNCGRPPPIENGDIQEIAKVQYLPGESVTYQCQSHYRMEGFPRVTCQNGHWSEIPTCTVPCTASEEDMRRHNIQLKWLWNEKLYSEAGGVIEFACRRGFHPHPRSKPFRVQCIEGKLDYPDCIRN